MFWWMYLFVFSAVRFELIPFVACMIFDRQRFFKNGFWTDKRSYMRMLRHLYWYRWSMPDTVNAFICLLTFCCEYVSMTEKKWQLPLGSISAVLHHLSFASGLWLLTCSPVWFKTFKAIQEHFQRDFQSTIQTIEGHPTVRFRGTSVRKA